MLQPLENGHIIKDPKLLKFWLTNEISSSINHTVIKRPSNSKNSKKN